VYRAYASNGVGDAWAAASESFLPTASLLGVTAAAPSPLGDEFVTFNGVMTATGSTAEAWLYYGTADGGTSPVAWAHAVALGSVTDTVAELSHTVTGLAPNQNLFYRFRATNCVEEVWSSAGERLTTAFFCNGVKIQFHGYDGPETLTNFPALVLLDPTVPGFDYATFKSASGGDLRFINGDRTQFLNHEIEAWDTNGTSRIWVQVPELAGTNTCIYARWNSADNNHPAYTTNGATWSEGYEAVWHFNSTDVIDSTAFGRHGTNTGAIALTNGPVGEALAFDGSSEVNITGYQGVTGTMDRTITAWARTTTAGDALVSWGNDNFGERWTFRVDTGGEIRMEVRGGNIIHDQVMTDGAWHHAAVSWAADASPNISDGNLYLDGRVGFDSGTFEVIDTASGVEVQLGTDHNGRDLLGDLDEVRISSVARSSNWIWAVWMNSGSNAAFNSYTTPTDLLPAITNRPATDIGSSLARLHAEADGFGNGFTAEVFWGPADGGTNAGAWANQASIGVLDGNGPTSLAPVVTGLVADTTNYFTFRLSKNIQTVWAMPSEPVVTAPGGAVVAANGSGVETENGLLQLGWELP
ncbi:MAG: DUF2341 domain-containing protein, partial [Verrucomicrobiota bacterium]